MSTSTAASSPATSRKKTVKEFLNSSPPKPLGGKVRVYNSDFLKNLVVEDESSSHATSSGRTPVQRTMKSAVSHQQEEKKRILEQQNRKQAEKLKLEREQRAERVLRQREQKFQTMFNTLLKERETVLQEIEESLSKKERVKQHQREELYKQWCENIFDPIQTQIQQHVDAMDSKELSARRDYLFSQYINTCKRRDLFLDIVQESEYDPFEAQNNTIKVKVSSKDPLKKDLRKQEEERRGVGIAVPKAPPTGRDVFEVSMWSKVESTPFYDRVVEEEKKRANRQQQQQGGDRKDVGSIMKWQSKVPFDHYTYHSGPPPAEEVPRGKRVFANWKPGQTIHDI